MRCSQKPWTGLIGTERERLHKGSASILSHQAAPLFAASPSGKELRGIENLRKCNFELEQELSEVKRDLIIGNEKAFD